MSKSQPSPRHSLMKQPNAILIPSLPTLVEPLSIKVEAEGNIMEITSDKLLKFNINLTEANMNAKKDALEYIMNLAQQYIEDNRVKRVVAPKLIEPYSTELKDACNKYNIEFVSPDIQFDNDLQADGWELIGINGDHSD